MDREGAVLTEIERRRKRHRWMRSANVQQHYITILPPCKCVHVRSPTRTAPPRTHEAGALTFPSSLPGWERHTGGVLGGPSQHPLYTRAPFREEAVGSSESKHHRAPQAQPMIPQQHPTRDESLACSSNMLSSRPVTPVLQDFGLLAELREHDGTAITCFVVVPHISNSGR